MTNMASRRSISQSQTSSFPEKTIDSKHVKHRDTKNKEICLEHEKVFDGVDLTRLSNEEKEIYNLHLEACQKGESMYKDPSTGYAVFTEVFHKQRNSCCGNACRHCPYNHENVPPNKRTKKFNSAFYSD